MTRILYVDDAGCGLDLAECLNDAFHDRFFEKTGKFFTEDYRDDPVTFEVIDELGGLKNVVLSAYSLFSLDLLGVRVIPSGTSYFVHNFDGLETIITEHEVQWRVA